MLGPNKENLGVMPRAQALDLAKPESGLDLIEVVPEANPPVVRVMSYDKFRYEREKALKKERVAQKTLGLKQVQISARAAENDVAIKVKLAEKFLTEGHQVEVNLRLRGREKAHKDWARTKMNEFLKKIAVEYKLMSEPKFGGRGMVAAITKK